MAICIPCKGLINIQFIAIGEDVYVIEVNPRSSRTVPYISKVTGIPIVDLATEVILGKTIGGRRAPGGVNGISQLLEAPADSDGLALVRIRELFHISARLQGSRLSTLPRK